MSKYSLKDYIVVIFCVLIGQFEDVYVGGYEKSKGGGEEGVGGGGGGERNEGEGRGEGGERGGGEGTITRVATGSSSSSGWSVNPPHNNEVPYYTGGDRPVLHFNDKKTWEL